MLYFKHSKDTNPEATHTVKQDDGANIVAPTFPSLQKKGGGRKLPSSSRAATEPSITRSDRSESRLVLNRQTGEKMDGTGETRAMHAEGSEGES